MARERMGGQMTVQEAGRKGGETVSRKYGPGFYSKIGHMGGQKVKKLIQEGEMAGGGRMSR